MKSDLGMKTRITRRDILHGMAGLATAAALPGCAIGGLTPPPGPLKPDYYPPALTGLRGNHKGSFESGHQLGREGRTQWGVANPSDAELYDLIVVGGGISGLSAAHTYQKEYPQASILILDNHDDFGGHAKRNEFQVGGRTLIGYGGSQTMQEPSDYSDTVKDLLRDLAINVDDFDSAYDQDFYRRNGLRAGIYFNQEKWGKDTIVPYDLGIFSGYMPMAESSTSAQQAVAQMPISALAKTQFLHLLTLDQDQIPEHIGEEKSTYLSTISYRAFLQKHVGISDAEVFDVLQDLASDSGVGIETVPALNALNYAGLPGRRAAGLPPLPEPEAYIHHFPDGNASIARALVQKLIPAVASSNTMAQRVTTRFDYSQLDQSNSLVKLRLNSTVINVEHAGKANSAKRVNVSYVRNGQHFQVQGRNCVLACYNAMIPHLCPQLPAAQREALSRQVKTPILYTNVALRNWRAWKNLGIGAVVAPTSYHVNAALDFPVSIGDYHYANDADQPVIIHMERFPHVSNQGLSPHQQFRMGRHELLNTPFEDIEHNIRSQLTGMLSAGGFDPARDIEAITVNRWAHGYASWYNPMFEPVFDDWQDPRYPHIRGRKRFGRISIANSDAAANAMMESAIEQGHRAATELL